MENKVYQTDIFGNMTEIKDEEIVEFKQSNKDTSLQPMLFENLDETWKKEWKGMPEFIQKDEKPIQQIIVSFLKKEDVKKFGELMGQNVTYQTKSLWFPKLENEKPSDYIYES